MYVCSDQRFLPTLEIISSADAAQTIVMYVCTDQRFLPTLNIICTANAATAATPARRRALMK